jgi:serine-type D-Ala-D-Ala carboxypeptidase/endopeptidase (penicillin-binding protein 4)
LLQQDTVLNPRQISRVGEFFRQMDDVFNDINFSNAYIGVVIQSLKTGEYFYKKNEDKLLTPASNLKLFTTAAGLLELGSDFRYETPVYHSGEIDGSILRGDLIVQGSGDPTMSGRFYSNDMYAVFNKWADSLLILGIDEISGNIIGDDNSFEDRGYGNGWAWDYESYWYAAPSGALSFNDNCIDLTVYYDAKNRVPWLRLLPQPSM